MKTITTGTKITFTETGDKFELIQTPSGFDVKRIKLSKNITPEHFTFQELLDLYESGKITIQGFEEADAALINCIFINHIHNTEIEALKADVTRITDEKEVLEAANQQLTTANGELTTESSQLKTTNQELTAANEKLTIEKASFDLANTKLTAENEELKSTNEKLNTALSVMGEEEQK